MASKGWDWGPTLLTCGPWRPVYIVSFDARITDVSFQTCLSEDLKSAQIDVLVEFEGDVDEIDCELTLEGFCVARARTKVGVIDNKTLLQFHTRDPRLWYPFNYGNQPIYLARVQISNGGKRLDTNEKRFAIRNIKLSQTELKDAPGTSFTFEVNQIPIFCGGSNWIPAHSFLTALTLERYSRWLDLVLQSNQVMVRVWGGGIYESDAFYDACDERGILVWQDFMFACGNYPASEGFLQSVKEEAIANVRRLRHHPCIAIFAGNNEDYAYAESEGLDYDPEDLNPEHWLQSSFPARCIYEKILPDIVAALTPDTPYHIGSPWGGKNSSDPSRGDIHQWNMWHGSQERYQNLDRLSGRFISEFGMEAYPDMKTLDDMLEDRSTILESHPQSSTVEFHNKAAGSSRRLATYLAENIRYTLEPFEQYVYCTQLIQSEAIGTAFRLWKRGWKGSGQEYCSGALVWQMNDCWPAISWSIVDHDLRPKMAFYVLKREMQPLTIGMKRTTRRIPRDRYTNAHFTEVTELELWVCSLILEETNIQVDLVADTLVIDHANDSGNKPHIRPVRTTLSLPNDRPDQTFTIPPNRTTELGKVIIPDNPSRGIFANQTIVRARAQSVVEKVGSTHDDSQNNQHRHRSNDSPSSHNILVAESFNWPEPLKHVHLPKPTVLSITLHPPDQDSTASSPSRTVSPSENFQSAAVATDDNVVLPALTRPRSKPSGQAIAVRLVSDVPLKCVVLELIDADDHNIDTASLTFSDQGFDLLAGQVKWVHVRVRGADSILTRVGLRDTREGDGDGKDEGKTGWEGVKVQIRYLGMTD